MNILNFILNLTGTPVKLRSMNIAEKPRFFAEFTLSDKTRFFAPLRMTGEGLRMARERLKMTGEGFNMAGCSWIVILSRWMQFGLSSRLK